MPSIRYLALGDSYTVGSFVDVEQSWPNQLADRLRARGYSVEVTVIAHGGWTTDELWQGIRENSPQPPYDLVSLLIGVNNQFRGYDLDAYRRHFAFLLGKAVEYAGGNPGRVLVLSIPDWSVTPSAEGWERARISVEIEAFNAVNRDESARASVRYVDITPASRRAASDASLIAADGLHPSAAMYSLWVDLAQAEAEAALMK